MPTPRQKKLLSYTLQTLIILAILALLILIWLPALIGPHPGGIR